MDRISEIKRFTQHSARSSEKVLEEQIQISMKEFVQQRMSQSQGNLVQGIIHCYNQTRSRLK